VIAAGGIVGVTLVCDQRGNRYDIKSIAGRRIMIAKWRIGEQRKNGSSPNERIFHPLHSHFLPRATILSPCLPTPFCLLLILLGALLLVPEFFYLRHSVRLLN
jgi:hypothetical protein